MTQKQLLQRPYSAVFFFQIYGGSAITIKYTTKFVKFNVKFYTLFYGTLMKIAQPSLLLRPLPQASLQIKGDQLFKAKNLHKKFGLTLSLTSYTFLQYNHENGTDITTNASPSGRIF